MYNRIRPIQKAAPVISVTEAAWFPEVIGRYT